MTMGQRPTNLATAIFPSYVKLIQLLISGFVVTITLSDKPKYVSLC